MVAYASPRCESLADRHRRVDQEEELLGQAGDGEQQDADTDQAAEWPAAGGHARVAWRSPPAEPEHGEREKEQATEAGDEGHGGEGGRSAVALVQDVRVEPRECADEAGERPAAQVAEKGHHGDLGNRRRAQ